MFSYLWAKKGKDLNRLKWLPLDQHLEDTMYVIDLLWEHWLSPGQADYIISLMGSGDPDKAKSLVKFSGAVHDIGKATPTFQVQEGFNNSEDLDFALLEKLNRAGFYGIEDCRLGLSKKKHHTLMGQVLLMTYGVNEGISSIIGSHHGKPLDEKINIKEELNAFSANYFQTENDSLVNRKWHGVQDEVYDFALKKSGFEKTSDLPEIDQTGQVILSGLLIMADWIASNEDYFPLIPIDQDQVEDRSKRIEEGWTKWEKGSLWHSSYVEEDIDRAYLDRFGFLPRDAQKVFSETIASCQDPGIFIFEAPMGMGKTEAALMGAEDLAYKTGRGGIFFGLPSQATSNGIFPRISSWMEELPKDEDDHLQIRLKHGKSSLNENFRNIAKNIDQDGDGSVIVNEWFSGRKTAALDDFVVGTVDQFLMIALKQRHLALRHLGFSKKVVIIDEVHAYDAYMNQYLYQAIMWMGAYRVPVIILSATLSEDKREEILKSYMRGRGLKWRDVEKPEKLDDESSYPLISYSDGDKILQEKDFKQSEDKKIKIERLDEEDLYEKVSQLIEAGGVVGIIVNTVKRAQDIARNCTERFGRENVDLLHSNFISSDRIKKEDRLLKTIGKNGNRPERKIVIGTQVMEQSLDIDFDVLITDLSPIDLIIQRIGRLHRHDRIRPKKHQDPVCYVMGMSDTYEFEKGSSFIYGDYLLIKSQEVLGDSINIPSQIPILVEKVYGKDLLVEDSLKGKYKTARDKHKIRIKLKTDKADKYRLNKPNMPNKGSLIGWLKNSNRASETSEATAYAQVRDIEETIEVIAVKELEGGYGLFAGKEDISKDIDDPEIARRLAQESLTLPRILSLYSKDRNIDDTIEALENINRKYFKAWQRQSWLKGELGLLFDKNNECFLCGVKLKYDERYGLTYEMEEKDGQI